MKHDKHAQRRQRDRAALANEVALIENLERSRHCRVVFGAPTRCPRCNDYGLIDSIDVLGGVQHNGCIRCGAEWTVTARALAIVAQNRRAVRATRPPARTSCGPFFEADVRQAPAAVESPDRPRVVSSVVSPALARPQWVDSPHALRLVGRGTRRIALG